MCQRKPTQANTHTDASHILSIISRSAVLPVVLVVTNRPAADGAFRLDASQVTHRLTAAIVRRLSTPIDETHIIVIVTVTVPRPGGGLCEALAIILSASRSCRRSRDATMQQRSTHLWWKFLTGDWWTRSVNGLSDCIKDTKHTKQQQTPAETNEPTSADDWYAVGLI